MTTTHQELLQSLLVEGECEWIEYKENSPGTKKIGEYISALANSALLHDKKFAYLLIGVNDQRELVGTEYNPKERDLISLHPLLTPTLHIEPLIYPNKTSTGTPTANNIVILRIPATTSSVCRFEKKAYIRVGSALTALEQHPQKEGLLWQKINNAAFEEHICKANCTLDEIQSLLDLDALFRLLHKPAIQQHDALVDFLKRERIVYPSEIRDKFDLSNLGFVLFAKDFADIPRFQGHSIRILRYQDQSKAHVLNDLIYHRGYAIAFEDIVETVSDLSQKEDMRGIIRKTTQYPAHAVRELIANALIHQDFSMHGTSVMIEIYSNRLKVSNPGIPLNPDLDRLLDTSPQSRNEELAKYMYRLGFFEGRGSGIDRIITEIENQSDAPPLFEISGQQFSATLFHKTFKEMTQEELIRACYQHACRLYEASSTLTNATLRARFGLEDQHISVVSRIIRDAKEANKIKLADPNNKSPKHMSYKPYWA